MSSRVAHRLRPLVYLTVLGAVLTAGGCGDSGSATVTKTVSAPAGAPSSTAAATSVPQADPAADKRAAASALITLQDFPAGWVTDPEDKKKKTLTSTCGLDKYASGRAGVGFKKAGSGVRSSAIVAKSTEDAQALFADLQDNLKDCLARSVQDTTTATTKIGKVTVADMSVDPLGDQSAGVRATIPFDSNGFKATLYADVVYTRQGRMVVMNTVTGLATDEDLLSRLTATAARRAAAANQ